ncbi:MAG: ankyrin repeat domain-containing protein [Acidobacteriota bacterium]
MSDRNHEQYMRAEACALSGDVEGLGVIAASGTDLSALLFEAAASGKGRTLSTLIQAGVPLNVLDASGRTPLDVAREAGEKECAEMIRRGGGRHSFDVVRR